MCAERAIECALRDGQRVVYCSPIKALSNQKFQDLRLKFGSRVGLITGDVTLEEDSPCLVMTTEILRGVLYRGSTLMRELKWLIIDEVHLLGDGARGWVIEETLILLPQTVRFVLLSATVPNAIDISEWVTTLHRTPCHVVHSPRRPLRCSSTRVRRPKAAAQQRQVAPMPLRSWRAVLRPLLDR